MNIYTNTPYTYRISWSKTGMNYYGVRYAKGCHPSDLFVTYFTSSDYVADYIKEHGLPDIIEVRKTFTGEDRRKKAILHEQQTLKRLKVVGRQDYLNKHDIKAIDVCDPQVAAKIKATNATPETKQRRSEAVRRMWADPETKAKRIAAANTPEVKANRKASLAITNLDPEVHARRSASSVEINSRPAILKANQERFLGKTFEELFGEEKATRIKELQSASLSKMWADGLLKGRCGIDNNGADKNIYEWQNIVTGEKVSMARSVMCAKYNLANTNVQKLFYNRGKLNRRGRYYSVQGWMLLP
jgi:hypothetical protein